MYLSGPLLTYHCFKQCAAKRLRSIFKAEFEAALTSIQQQGLGRTVRITLPRQRQAQSVFIKTAPDSLPADATIDSDRYTERYNMPVNKQITEAMRNELVSDGHVQDHMFQ